MYKYLLFTIGVFISFLISDQLSAQNMTEGWLTTEATITKITDEGVRRRNMRAAITYKTEDGKNHNTYIKLTTIPFLGTFKKVGGKITILYDPANPEMVKSQSSNFLDSYGTYIMIAVGVFFSFFSLKNMFGSKNKT